MTQSAAPNVPVQVRPMSASSAAPVSGVTTVAGLAPGTEYPEDQAAPGSPIDEVGHPAIKVSAFSQSGVKRCFKPDTDALAFRVDVTAAQPLAGFAARLTLLVVDLETNTPARVHSSEFSVPLGQSEFSIFLGNTEPSGQPARTTPKWWGLRAGLYACRAVLEAAAANTLSLSDPLAFRVADAQS